MLVHTWALNYFFATISPRYQAFPASYIHTELLSIILVRSHTDSINEHIAVRGERPQRQVSQPLNEPPDEFGG